MPDLRPPPFPVLVPPEALARAAARRAEGRALLLNANKPGYSERFTIEAEQYDLVVDALMAGAAALMDDDGEVLLKELVAHVQATLEAHPRFPSGRLTNFARYVKVDLEARGQLLRVSGRSPQRLRYSPAASPAD